MKYFLVSLGVCGVFVSLPLTLSAVEITQLDLEPRGDFVLMPGKDELFLEPGQETTHYIQVTNRFDTALDFTLSVEDIAGSSDPHTTVELLGDQIGPYSLKEYLDPSVDRFTLEPGERGRIPVRISIPEDAPPGGLYGSVIVANEPTSEVTSADGARFVSRLGSLLLIRVAGEVEESGQVTDFFITRPDETLRQQHPDAFGIHFENTGSVHLVPYGMISVTNLMGNEIAQIPVDAYFALPDSLRNREIFWEGGPFAFGRYTATLHLDRGYDDIVDEMSISYWVIPWQILLIVIGFAFALSFFIYFLTSRFEIRRKG